MATTTSVLGLTKPAYSESADVTVLNSDFDLIDAEAGRARGNIAADYSASQAYAVGDLCLYGGVLYRCTTAIGSGGEAWNSGHWSAVKIAGQLSALSDQIAKKPYRSMKQLSAGNTVSFTLPSYTDSCLIFSAESNSSGILYIYCNGYVLPVKENSHYSVSVSNGYKTINVTATAGLSSTYVGVVSCNGEIT